MANQINTVDPSFYGKVFNITKEKSNVVLDAAAKAGHRVTRIFGYNTSPDHNDKCCIDFMHYGNTAMRNWLTSFLIDNANALGVVAIISNRKCLGFPSHQTGQAPTWSGQDGHGGKGSIDGGVWRPYSGPNPHTDHVHAQFNTNPIKGSIAGGGTKPKKSHHKIDVTRYCKDDGIKSYNADGSVDSVRPKGYKVEGYWVTRSDGKYLRTAWDHDYPEDDLVKKQPAVGKKEKAVSLTALRAAARKDPDRKQGGQSPDAVDDVKMVEAALQAEGFLPRKYAHDGSFGSSTVEAYSKWQKKLGYTGKDADGIPGMASLRKLGDKYDFAVTDHD